MGTAVGIAVVRHNMAIKITHRVWYAIGDNWSALRRLCSATSTIQTIAILMPGQNIVFTILILQKKCRDVFTAGSVRNIPTRNEKKSERSQILFPQ